MKLLSALLPLLGLISCLSADAIVPKVESSPRCMVVTGVERLDTCTRVSVSLQHYPKYWVRITDNAFLHAVGDTTRHYKVIGEENIPFGKKIKMPESGRHSGTLIFERVPDDVNVVDLVLDDINDVSGNVLGIYLDEEDTTVYPDLLSAADLFNSNERPSEEWAGLDPSRYKDMSFYRKDGMTYLRGRIVDYSPRCGITTVTIRTKDDITDLEKKHIGDINPDGTFALDIPVTYPQFDYFTLGKINMDLFLIPGDTLSLVTSLKMHIAPGPKFEMDCHGFEGDLDDGIVINLLADSIIAHYNLMDLRHEMQVQKSDSMQAQTYAAAARVAERLDSVMNDLPAFIGNLPISNFAKDILSVNVLGTFMKTVESLDMDFRDAKGPTVKRDSLGKPVKVPGEQLDLIRFLSPTRKYFDKIYDNPLMLCKGWVLPNRWKFNSVFMLSLNAAKGMEENENGAWVTSKRGPKATVKADIARLDSLGLGDCFVAQFVRNSSVINTVNSAASNISKSYNPRLSAWINPVVINQLKHSDYDVLDEALLSAYNALITNVAIADNQLSATEDAGIDTSAYGGVLEKIIAPFKGNVLFLDFWDIGCGPCRAGMVEQKSLLEEYAGKPFKALYIANGDGGRSSCEKWLAENNIKGEHIFVSRDDWNRLQALFNFSAIPFGAIIDKNGKVVKTRVRFLTSKDVDKLLSE